ncbi:hypothetical protein IU483_30030 [Streptomyces gardneri]|nr:hypothetical protein [Streptomyces gardneri]
MMIIFGKVRPLSRHLAQAHPQVSIIARRVSLMSVNIHLSLYVEKLSSPAQADTIEMALDKVLKEHGIDSWMLVSVFHNPPWVKASSENGPIIVRGFSEWSKTFERDVTDVVRGIAPEADIDLEWGYPDEERPAG